MNSSIDKLSKKIVQWNFIPDDLDDLRHKQHFPYSYFTELPNKNIFQILDEKELPQDPLIWDNSLRPKFGDDFNIQENLKAYKDLTQVLKEANESFYKHKCQNIRDNVLLYLKVDILLLAEIIFEFRNNNLDQWQLDPLYYVSLPGYAWRAMLRFTDIKLDLLSDIEMINFFQ